MTTIFSCGSSHPVLGGLSGVRQVFPLHKMQFVPIQPSHEISLQRGRGLAGEASGAEA